jgi:hypothetical protein
LLVLENHVYRKAIEEDKFYEIDGVDEIRYFSSRDLDVQEIGSNN